LKVAISTDSGMVAAHFGRCPEFTILEIENDVVKNKEVLANPGHEMGAIPKFMHQNGVQCMIAGGMGHRAVAFFSEFGIETIVGVTGSIDDTIDKILKEELEGGESLCKPQAGRGYGLDRTDVDHSHHH